MRRLIPFAALALFGGACAEARKGSQGPVYEAAPSASQADKVQEAGPADHNPREVVERAILVHGGPLQLARLRNHVRTEKGEITRFGRSSGSQRTLSMALPQRSRWDMELHAPTQKVLTILALDGDKGWFSSGGALSDFTKDQVWEMQADTYLCWMLTLVPLTDGDRELTALPPVMIDKQPALGIKVTSKDRPELKLYFDQKTGLLARAERPGREAELPVSRVYLFSDIKDFGGVKMPSKQVELMNGSKIAEWTITGYKPVDSLPDSTFAKP